MPWSGIWWPMSHGKLGIHIHTVYINLYDLVRCLSGDHRFSWCLSKQSSLNGINLSSRNIVCRFNRVGHTFPVDQDLKIKDLVCMISIFNQVENTFQYIHFLLYTLWQLYTIIHNYTHWYSNWTQKVCSLTRYHYTLGSQTH